MTGDFSTIASGVMAADIGFGIPPEHLIAACDRWHFAVAQTHFIPVNITSLEREYTPTTLGKV